MNSDVLENGYTVVSDLLNTFQCEKIADELPDFDGAGTRRLLDLEIFSILACQLKANPVLTEILRGLSAIQCIFFNKTRERNWSVQTHRDTVVPIDGFGPWESAGYKEGRRSAKPSFQFLARCLVVRLALDDCKDPDLELHPGSHTCLDTKRSDATAVVVPKGGALILRPTLLHASRKLDQSSSRRVLHYLFAPSAPPYNYKWYHSV